MRRRCAYFRHRTSAHVNNGHHQRIASVGRLYDVDSRRGAAVKARPREQHLVVPLPWDKVMNGYAGERSAEDRAVTFQGAAARPVADLLNHLEAACLDFIDRNLRRNTERAAQPGKRRRQVDDDEHTARAQGLQQAGIDARRVSQVVIHTPQHDRVAAAWRQSGLTALRLYHRDVVEPGAAGSFAQARQTRRVDFGREDAPARPTSLASASVSWPLPAPTSASTIPSFSASTCRRRAISGPPASKPNPLQLPQPAHVSASAKALAVALPLLIEARHEHAALL